MTATAGFLLAARGSVHWITLGCLLLGMALVIGSSCVFNNYIDRDIDKKMTRTKHRALVEGTISPRNALLFASSIGIAGFAILVFGTNAVTVAMGLLGAVFYIVVYGIGKRKTVHGTLIGSISGATPPVAGYTAVTGRIDSAAIILFFILILWQMPHFFAIASYRRKEYAAAGLPVLPVKRDIASAQLQSLIYIGVLTLVLPLLTVLGYTGISYLVIVLLVSFYWLYFGISKYRKLTGEAWARQMFHVSLIVLSVWSVTVSVDHFLP
jgi:protoheme IX farnesyltransferase